MIRFRSDAIRSHAVRAKREGLTCSRDPRDAQIERIIGMRDVGSPKQVFHAVNHEPREMLARGRPVSDAQPNAQGAVGGSAPARAAPPRDISDRK
jgi:hypothetical protein